MSVSIEVLDKGTGKDGWDLWHLIALQSVCVAEKFGGDAQEWLETLYTSDPEPHDLFCANLKQTDAWNKGAQTLTRDHYVTSGTEREMRVYANDRINMWG